MEDGKSKFALFLIILGMIIAAIGAAATFAWSAALIVLFYIGFVVAIIGFAIAVLEAVSNKN